MHSLNIQLSDDTYAALAAVAQSNGRSVEAIAADQLKADFTDELPVGFWTPELLANIDAVAAEANQGGSLTIEQVREQRLAKGRAWRANHPA